MWNIVLKVAFIVTFNNLDKFSSPDCDKYYWHNSSNKEGQEQEAVSEGSLSVLTAVLKYSSD